MSKGKKLLFSLVAFVLVASVGLGAVELALRFAGYGYSTSFFREVRIGGEPMLVENDKFGLRFFPPEMARSPAPVVMKAHKAPGTYRIFIFGESAALGDPRPAFGPARCLEKLLVERYPAGQFEIVCTAMTAINSHAILPIARECARRQGDLWLIYMGNNEMVGPFGAASVFGSQAPSTVYARLVVSVQRFRVGQWLMAAARHLAGHSSERLQWEGMSMFLKNQLAPNDPRKEVVYRNFARNLNDIVEAGRGAGAEILLNTVAVNLQDCAPFASVSGLQGDAQSSFQMALTNGLQAEVQGDQKEARRFYEEAAALAPLNADAHFRLGTVLRREGDAAAAARHLEQARDLDALPFRADSRINAIISETANRKGTTAPRVIDAVTALASKASADLLPGEGVFHEHVHLNFDGNYRLGRAWAEEVAPLLPAVLTDRAKSDWLTQEACERKLGLTDWNREAVVRDVLRRLSVAPFTRQSNHEERIKRLQARLAELRPLLNPEAAKAARALCLEAVAAVPNDHRLHETYAEFLEATGDAPLALEEWNRVRELLPHHHVAYYHCGRLALRQGNLPEAEKQLTTAVTLRPDLAEGWLSLGQLEAGRGRQELALTHFERERRLAPDDPRVYYFMGRACSKLGRRAEAIGHFQEAVRLRASYWEAHYMLGEELAFAGEAVLARSQFEQVLRLKPDYAMAHFNLAVALIQAGDRTAAVMHLEEAHRLDPANPQAAEALKKIR